MPNPHVKIQIPSQESDKPYAIICDIDGTVALNISGRNHYATDETLLQDIPREHVIFILKSILDNLHISGYKSNLIFLSGRSETSRRFTEQWLKTNQLAPPRTTLLMRSVGDFRQDAIIKEEIYDTKISPYFNVIAIFDDRPQVVRMWQRKGLPIFCVNENYDEDF